MEIVIDRAAVLLVCQKAIIYLCLTKLLTIKLRFLKTFILEKCYANKCILKLLLCCPFARISEVLLSS